MRIAIDSFRGEVPRLTPRALPETSAQLAINCKLVSGDLEAWDQFALVQSLVAAAAVKTIYLLKDRWLSWTEQVDVARGVIPGDNTYRTYLTCPTLYGQPQFTNYAMATTGAQPYPVQTRPLGVPAPTEEPDVSVSVTAADESNVSLTNAGAEAGTTTGWTITAGSLVVYTNGDIVGLDGQAGSRFFGGGVAAASSAYQDVDLAAAGVIEGQGLKLVWYQATGAAGSTAAMSVEFYDDVSALISTASLPQEAPATALSWERREMTAEVPAGAVTARLIQSYVLVGGGPTIDAYIDGIALAGVDYSNFFDGSTLSGWDASPNSGGPGDDKWRQVYVDASVGWSAPSWMLRGDEMVPWLHRDFSTDQSPAVTVKFDMYHSGTGNGLMVMLFASDVGRGSAVFLGPSSVGVHSCSSWDDYGASVETLTGTVPIYQRHTVTITAEQISASQARLTITVETGGVVTVDAVRATVPIDGPRIAFKGNTGTLESDWNIDNVYVTVAAPRSRDTVESTATSYVYRFLNDLGEPSAPSPVSDTVIRPDGGSVVITTPIDVPSGISAAYGITTKQIFRAVTGAAGSVFVLVVEIPLAQAEYTDAFDDSQIAGNEVLDSDDFDLPPDDLEGIIALPNGIMAGFRRNQLCFSAQNWPHAWPVAYRLNTDSDIVAIANVDTTVVIATKTFVYTASGSTPDSYSMSKPGVPQACVSKRSMANLFGGVVFASPDGLMLVASPTQVQNLTAGLFTRQQWQELRPESIVGVVHDDVYHFFYDPLYSPSGAPAGYAIDAKQDGFGVVSLGYHAAAAHTDPLTDGLYLVLDDVDEPSAAYLPLASSAPTPNGRTIYRFDADDGNLMAYRWRGKLNLLTRPAVFQMLRVQAAEFDNLVLRLYADGALIVDERVTSDEEFTLPMADACREFEVELIGTSRVRRVQAVEDVVELS